MEAYEYLKSMYKQIPKELLRNKWELCFILSVDNYYKVKEKLHNDKFLGIDIKTGFRIEKDNMYIY